MVEPVNIEQALAGSVLASNVRQTSKEKRLSDRKAFNTELQRAEQLKESQIHETDEAETENRIKDQEEQREGGQRQPPGKDEEPEEPEKGAEDSVNNVPQSPNPKLLEEGGHEVDLQA
jgi:hypothetical protein